MKAQAGDIVYIYVGKPTGSICYQCEVLRADLPEPLVNDGQYVKGNALKAAGTYMDLHCLRTFPDEALPLANLKANGLKTVQGPSRVSAELSAYISGFLR